METKTKRKEILNVARGTCYGALHCGITSIFSIVDSSLVDMSWCGEIASVWMKFTGTPCSALIYRLCTLLTMPSTDIRSPMANWILGRRIVRNQCKNHQEGKCRVYIPSPLLTTMSMCVLPFSISSLPPTNAANRMKSSVRFPRRRESSDRAAPWRHLQGRPREVTQLQEAIRVFPCRLPTSRGRQISSCVGKRTGP